MNSKQFPHDPPLELPHDQRKLIPVHADLKAAIDAARPKGLHRHQWIHTLLVKGLQSATGVES